MAQLSSTFRNLFGEQNKMALYSLAETMQNFMFNILFNGRADDSGATITYSGLPANAPGGKGDGTYLRSLTDFSPITDPPALALGLDLQKVPDLPNGGNRWTILNTAFYRKLTQDTNFMVAEAIANASQGVAANALGTGKLPTLQNINFRKSQMMADNYVLGGGGQTENFTAATRIGFAGAKESLVFCNRVPNDYTTAFNKLGIEVPPNARVEIVTEPRSGFRVMVVFAIDHGVDATSSIASANLLAYAMYGGAVGNPNVGFAISQQ
jgi:hypothetical protein